jgi:hypothetical protein
MIRVSVVYRRAASAVIVSILSLCCCAVAYDWVFDSACESGCCTGFQWSVCVEPGNVLEEYPASEWDIDCPGKSVRLVATTSLLCKDTLDAAGEEQYYGWRYEIGGGCTGPVTVNARYPNPANCSQTLTLTKFATPGVTCPEYYPYSPSGYDFCAEEGLWPAQGRQ